MKVIPRDTRRVTYSTEIRELKTIPFTKVQRAVVIGSILGDGSLLANWSKTNYRLSINHCIEQKEYLLWKYRILKNYILSEPRFYERNNSLTIRTISHHELTALRNIFYNQNRKIIPKCVEEFLNDPLVLAIWFMDDGNGRWHKGCLNGIDINTQSFTLEENNRLAAVMRERWNIICSINENNRYYRLHILSRSLRAFRKLILPHILPSMRYKLWLNK